MEINELRAKFKKIFGREGAAVFFAPGRANLIGEHTDYNGGHVFPCALTFGTYLAASKRQDGKINFYSLNFEDDGIISADISEIKKGGNWADYPKGVVAMFKEDGHILNCGFDALYYGDVPNGAGLSSSASIEVVTAAMINDFYNLGYNLIELAKISQRAENGFVGMNCGIMDQFASAMGKKDNAMLLDCNTLEYSYCPIALQGISILIANTNNNHKLTGSEYNTRRSQCEEALKLLQSKYKVNYLCEMKPSDLEKGKDLISDEVLYRRARHAVEENARTLEAVALLKKGDIAAFGKLMDASHESLKNNYEVTGKALDTMADALHKCEGVIGARMMGGGFGGCCIALVKNEFLEEVQNKAGAEYEAEMGIKPSFYVAQIGSGAKKI